jgi:hypothetical protein
VPAIAVGTDGGLFLTTDGGASFDFRKNVGLNTFLTQTVTTSGANQTLAITGMQDDGSRARLGTTTTWNQVTGGDGEGVGWSQANNARTLSSAEFNSIYWSPGLGADTIGTWHNVNLPNGLFFTPLTTPTAAADPTGLLFLTANLFGAIDTPDGGANWFYFALAGANLPLNWNTRDTWHAVGLDPNAGLSKLSLLGTGGRVAVSTDGGNTFGVTTLPGLVPNVVGFLSLSSWSSNGILYVASERAQPGTVKVVRSADSGTTWSQADFGLPDAPVFDVLADPRDASGNTVYAATYFGVYWTQNGGSNWSLFGAGLPIVRANGLFLSANGTLRVATYGRGIWETTPSAPAAAVAAAE